MVSDRGRKLVRTLLILAANPKGTERLRLDEEVKKIEQGLERSKRRDQFKLVVKWAVTDDDLRRAMLDNEPEIVHFSGHGSGESQGGQGRDLVAVQAKESGGLAFEDDGGHVQLISGDALARLFELCADSVKCVVLNACYSEAQADAIAEHIDYVVGMKKAIGDEAAIKFAVGFYDALGAGRDVEKAFKFGCIAIDLKGIPEYLTPVLKKKSISATVPTAPSSASPPDPSSAGLPCPQSGDQSLSVPGFGTATAPDGDPGNIVSAAGTSSPTSATAGINVPIRLFYSYSHKDETLRDELEEALALLKRQGLISGWHDRKIGAGDEWKGAIDKNLEEAQVVLLLVSASFLASDYCWDVETKRAVERHDQGEAKVIPVILRPCDWHGAPFGKLQALPKDVKAVTSWTNKDEAWTDVAVGIRRAVEAMTAKPSEGLLRSQGGAGKKVGAPTNSGAPAFLQEAVIEKEKEKARGMVALFDRGAFKIDHPYERTAPLYRSLKSTREELQVSGRSALLLHDVSSLFGEIIDILQKLQHKVDDNYPDVESEADKPGRLTKQDDENLKAKMGREYYDAANLMMSVRPQVEAILDDIRQHLDLKKPEDGDK